MKQALSHRRLAMNRQNRMTSIRSTTKIPAKVKFEFPAPKRTKRQQRKGAHLSSTGEGSVKLDSEYEPEFIQKPSSFSPFLEWDQSQPRGRIQPNNAGGRVREHATTRSETLILQPPRATGGRAKPQTTQAQVRVHNTLARQSGSGGFSSGFSLARMTVEGR